MNRSYLCIEAIILVLLTHVGWNDNKNMHLQCSRDKSRIVRNIINKKFIPILDRYRVSMPTDCPFHPQRDFLWWPESDMEDMEEDESNFHWTCPFCGLTFLCAETLSIHWDETHRLYFNQPEDSVCLADYCDIMRCDVIAGNKRKRKKRLKTEGLLKNKKESADKGYCNSSLMEKLEERCEHVVRQCTIGLLSNISLKDYRDIEYDLIRSICSYLTCDRYLDDYSKETRNVPLTLCLVIAIIMIGGFCLCYYIVWMLFDSGFRTRTAMMSRETMEDDSHQQIFDESLEFKSKQGLPESEILTPEDRIPISERPKILITSPSSQRIIRSQPFHYYHQHQQQYSNIDEDWESCDDIPTRTTAISMSTTAAIHPSVSRASSHTSKSIASSNPYR